jgi:hypothetical protein
MLAGFLFSEMKLSDPMVRDLRRMNPWWEGNPLPVLPATRRHLVAQTHHRLKLRLEHFSFKRSDSRRGVGSWHIPLV